MSAYCVLKQIYLRGSSKFMTRFIYTKNTCRRCEVMMDFRTYVIRYCWCIMPIEILTAVLLGTNFFLVITKRFLIQVHPRIGHEGLEGMHINSYTL